MSIIASFAATAGEAVERKPTKKHTSADGEPDGRHLQTDLVPGWLRATVGGRSQEDNDCK